MNNTKIEWASATWNPVTGCEHGCEYCYAQNMTYRFGGHWDEQMNRTVGGDGSIHDLQKPMIRHTKGKNRDIGVHNDIAPFPFYFEPTFHRYRLDQPRKEKKPQTIFVCSMADLFGAWVPDEWIASVFAACLRGPQHRYLFLTKNPKRYVELYAKGILPVRDNFWYGSTSTGPDVPFYYSRMPDDNPHTFVSIEPLLKPFGDIEAFPEWVIIGAETGNRKGKVTPEREWVDTIVRQARKHGVPVFMKDSLLPVVGEENMRREFPWNR